jgi:4-hydroxy-3-methylbut-2-en-1-yl diphosphate reductase
MKQFNIPEFYKSPIISKVKAKRKLQDPRKKDFTPTKLIFKSESKTIEFLIARHFGFCYGVENAIEIAYRAIHENPDKSIYLLSEMIHNPGVNEDLQSHGIQFIQDTYGKQLIDWKEIKANDIVIIPAFGTTLETENILTKIGVDVKAYNTTCPFVEKVWNRSEKLGKENHTIIIHGKHKHEETRATFSHSKSNAPSLVIKDIDEAKILCEIIKGNKSKEEFYHLFEGKYSEHFSVEKDLIKVGVVNQTTMLASETQEITELINEAMKEKYGSENIKEHIADTRDTLCYATNDNQTSTLGLLNEEVDLAIVIGGYNSSNTTHLVELLETKFPTYFIENSKNIHSINEIEHYNIHSKKTEKKCDFINPQRQHLKIAITSGASCPDAVVDAVIQKLLSLNEIQFSEEEVDILLE